MGNLVSGQKGNEPPSGLTDKMEPPKSEQKPPEIQPTAAGGDITKSDVSVPVADKPDLSDLKTAIKDIQTGITPKLADEQFAPKSEDKVDLETDPSILPVDLMPQHKVSKKETSTLPLSKGEYEEEEPEFHSKTKETNIWESEEDRPITDWKKKVSKSKGKGEEMEDDNLDSELEYDEKPRSKEKVEDAEYAPYASREKKRYSDKLKSFDTINEKTDYITGDIGKEKVETQFKPFHMTDCDELNQISKLVHPTIIKPTHSTRPITKSFPPPSTSTCPSASASTSEPNKIRPGAGSEPKKGLTLDALKFRPPKLPNKLPSIPTLLGGFGGGKPPTDMIGDYPTEYNAKVHGPYDPARYYGKPDTPFGQVKIGELGSWFARRNKHPQAGVALISRAFWRWQHKYVLPKKTTIAPFLQVVSASMVLMYSLNRFKIANHKSFKYH